MAPGHDFQGYYNSWKGFSLELAQGSWQKMKEHIQRIICANDLMLFRYVMGWLANMVQNPGTPGQVALVLKGKKGVGKGVFGNWLCKLLGEYSRQIVQTDQITGKFNSQLRNLIFLFADEITCSGDKRSDGVFKALITESEISIEGKYKEATTGANMLHILIASNYDRIVDASSDERRYCVLGVSDERKGDFKYFADIKTEMESGGLAAMLYDLLEFDLSNFEVRDVPQTTALFEQKIQSFDDCTAWWLSRLQEASVVSVCSGYWGPVLPKILYDDYVKAACTTGISKLLSSPKFRLKMQELLPPGSCDTKRMTTSMIVHGESAPHKHVSHYQIPALDVCRSHFDSLNGCSMQWDGIDSLNDSESWVLEDIQEAA